LPNFLTSLDQAEVYVLVKAATNTPPQSRPLWHLGTSSSATSIAGSIVDDFGRSDGAAIGVPLQRADQFHIYNVISAVGEWTARMNGRIVYTANHAGPSFPTSPTIGYDTHGDYFDGDIAELLIFNRVLTPDERDVVSVYLNRKYAYLTASPPTPGGLTMTGIAPYLGNLSWTNAIVTNTLLFTLERKTGAGGTFGQIAQVRDVTTLLDSSILPGQTYYYRVKSWNFNGESGYSPEISPPIVTITNPPVQNICSLGTNIPVSAAASVASGSISQVDFSLGNTNFATDTTSPYSVTLNNPGFGAFSLAAKATDSNGNSSFSFPVMIAVSPDTDGDGFDDMTEILLGTDPTNPLDYPHTPPGDPSDHTAPTIFLDEPSNATLLP